MSDIYKALNEVMKQVGYVQKKRSSGINYSFVGEAALIEAIRPHMVEQGVIVHPHQIHELRQDSYTTRNGAVMNRTAVVMAYRFAHADSGTFIDVCVAGEGADVGDKSANKALTGAYKYALRQALMIETGDDPDTFASEPPATASTDARGATSPTAQAERGRPTPTPAPADDDVDHMAEALAATNLKDFALNAHHVIDGYTDEFHIVGALTQKWPEAHGQKAFRFTVSMIPQYMEWLAERKAETAKDGE